MIETFAAFIVLLRISVTGLHDVMVCSNYYMNKFALTSNAFKTYNDIFRVIIFA